jgi:hypothetical protein
MGGAMRTGMIAGVTLVGALLATPALADDASSPSGPSTALLAGYGINERYSIGLGARLGYTFKNRLYAGGALVAYQGITNTTPWGDAKYHVSVIGAEGGYEIPLGPVLVRPYLAAGVARYTSTLCSPTVASVGGCVPTTVTDFTFGPGAATVFPIGIVFLGGDLRAELALGEARLFDLALFATGGIHL